VVKSLQEELKQSKPFVSVEVEAYVSLMRTYAILSQPLNDLFKEFGITQTLYNLMRIIRGGPEEGVPCSIISDRLVTRVPDVTRLVDRAVEAGLVERNRPESDRRVVLLSLTPKGTALLNEMQEPLLQAHHAQMKGLNKTELRTLIDLLARLRAGE
jgi:DNA-binding MarR family transcriptional regulator